MDELTTVALAAGDGDADALDRFVTSTYDQVLRCCSALVDGPSAADVTQEVYLRAVRALPSFRAEASARTWLLAIARRTCADEVRRRQRAARRREQAVPAGRPDVTGVADAGGALVVRDLVARLEPDRRAAFVLTQLVGCSYGEAAAVCGCAVGTIRSRVARARADLLRMVGGAPAGASTGAPGA